MAQKFLTDIEVTQGLVDSSGDLGVAGQVLSSTGTATNWITNEANSTVVYLDEFTGDNSTVDFTLSVSVTDENITQVYLDGVYQHKDTYSVSGTTLTFSTAPPLNADIEVITFSTATTSDDLAAGSVIIPVKNTHTASIAKGEPVYITGNVGSSARLQIAPADASNSAKMPAAGLLLQTLDVNAEGYVITGGYLRNITTDTIDGTSTSSNDTVYVKSGGGLTMTKPTGSNLIQNIAKVARSSGGNSGSLLVSSILRTNDVPNITNDYFWLGNSSGVATPTEFTSSVRGLISTSGNAISYNSSTGVITSNYEESPTFTGNVTISGNLTVDGTQTILNTQTVEVEDNILQLNTTQGSPDTATATTSGISVYRGNGVTQASFIFDDGDDTWDLTNNLVVAGTVDVNGSEITVGTSNSRFAENNLRFLSSGAAYIDHNTTGQSINFRVSNSSALDTTPLTIGSNGLSTFNGDIMANGNFLNVAQYIIHINDGDTYHRFLDDRQMFVAGNIEFIDFAETTQNYITIGGSSDIDTRMQGGSGYIFIQGSNGYIGVNDASPSYPLDIAGNTNISGELYITGNVGIGVSSLQPWARLQVAGTAGVQTGANQALYVTAPSTTAGEGVGIRLSAASGSNEAVGIIGMVNNPSGNSGSMTFHTYNGGADIPERMRIDNSGNVGIGTDSPSRELDVEKSSDNAIISAVSHPSYIAGLVLGDTSDDDRGGILYNNNGDYLYFLSNASERMRIDTSGNVGIGETGPAAKLHITNNAGANTTAEILRLDCGETNHYSGKGGKIVFRDISVYSDTATIEAARVGLSSASELKFTTRGVTRSVISRDGHTKMSNDGNFFSISAPYHEINQSSNTDWSCVLHNSASTPYGMYIKFSGASPNNTQEIIYFADATAQRFYVTSAGAVYGNGTYGTLSDQKLKENIVDATPKLDDINKLKVRNFNFKDKPEEKHIGFIAQEFEEVFPSMVETTQDKDDDNNPIEDSYTKTIKSSVLIPMLVKSIQELKAEIETLKNQINGIN